MRFGLIGFAMASIAMLCSGAVASQDLEKRAPKKVDESFSSTVDFLFKANSKIAAKVYADVCTDLDVSKAVETDIKLKASGIINFDLQVSSKIKAALKTSIKAAIKEEVDAQFKAEIDAKLKANIAAVIAKRCPNKDAASIRLQAKFIVSEAAKLTVKSSAQISAKVQAKIQARVKAAIDVQLKKLSINLLLVKLEAVGDVKISENLGLKFKAAAGLVAKACLDVQVKQVAEVKKICGLYL